MFYYMKHSFYDFSCVLIVSEYLSECFLLQIFKMATENGLSLLLILLHTPASYVPQLFRSYFSKIDKNFEKSLDFLLRWSFPMFHIKISCYFWRFFALLNIFWELYFSSYIYSIWGLSNFTFRSIYSYFTNIALFVVVSFNPEKLWEMQKYATWKFL